MCDMTQSYVCRVTGGSAGDEADGAGLAECSAENMVAGRTHMSRA